MGTLTKKDLILAKRCEKAVKKVHPHAIIIVFGSRCRGDYHPESDLDLLILTEYKLSPGEEEQIDIALYEIELETGIAICPILYDRSTWESSQYQVTPLAQHITREGITLCKMNYAN